MTPRPNNDAFVARADWQEVSPLQPVGTEAIPEVIPCDGNEEPNPFRDPEAMNWFDRQFAKTGLVILVLFPFCCGVPAFALGLAGTLACQHPRARRNAIVVLSISICWLPVYLGWLVYIQLKH